MVIADTGFFVALGNRRDGYHKPAMQRLRELTERAERLITTCAVVTEAGYLIFQRGGRSAQRAFMKPGRVRAIFSARTRETPMLFVLAKRFPGLHRSRRENMRPYGAIQIG